MADSYYIDENSAQILMDAVRRIRTLRGGPGINVQNSPSGITISLAPKQQTGRQGGGSTIVTVKLLSTLSARGQYDGAFYPAVKTAANGTTDSTADNVYQDPGTATGGSSGSIKNALVINPAELSGAAGSHALPTGDSTIYTALQVGVSTESTPRPVLMLIQGQKATFEARITAVSSGAFPAWTYTVQRVTKKDTTQTGYLQWVTDGTNLTATNRAEFAPQGGTYPYTYGNGVKITASDGTVNSGSCKIVPIGVGAVVNVSTDTDQSGNTVYSFSEMNSAQ